MWTDKGTIDDGWQVITIAHPEPCSGELKINCYRRDNIFPIICLLCWGLTTCQPLWVILCRLPEKGRKETEETAEEMKERNREERGTGMKVKKQKK